MNSKDNRGAPSPRRAAFLLALPVLVATTLSGCVVPEARRDHAAAQSSVISAAEAATVYVYPANGQSEAQLDRDRYECNLWSVKQSGYDPSQLHPEAERVNVLVGPPPGANTVAGAFTGALLGAAVSGPRQAAGGAAVGAIAGALLGATADAGRQEQADRLQERYDGRSNVVGQKAGDYRRAISACLEGRGYNVK